MSMYGLCFFLKVGESLFWKDSQKMENNAKVFETTKLNKILMHGIQLKHSSWDFHTKV
jgi:hypothetical protein